MRILALAVVVILVFISSVAALGTDSLPSMVLHNHKNMAILWATSKNAVKQDPVRSLGLTGFRIAQNWATSALKMDSFVLEIDGVKYVDSTKFGGQTYLDDSRGFVTTLESYDGGNLPVTLEITYYLPPGQEFYIIKVDIGNGVSRSGDHTVRIMNFVVTDNPSSSTLEWGWFDNTTGLFMVDLTKTGQFYFAEGFWDTGKQPEFQFGPSDASDPRSPLNKFPGTLTGNAVYEDETVCIGLVMEAVSGSSSYLFKTLGKDYAAAISIAKVARSKQPSDWVKEHTDGWNNWLSQAKYPEKLTKDELNLFTNSLILLKCAQNPTVGTIMASFHPLYQYKTWSRDGVFASMIFHSAGFKDEAKAYMNWMAVATLRDDGAYHTCYDWFVGSPVGFVEPQYDGTGTFLFSAFHFAQLAPSSSISAWMGRIRDIEDFFLNNVGKYQLAPPDYSIWEESSDPHSGAALPTSYFAFTQGMAAAGLYSASKLEHKWGDDGRSQKCLDRSNEIVTAIENELWMEDEGHYARGIWSGNMSIDSRMDSASTSGLFTGMLTNKSRSDLHMKVLRNQLTHLSGGIARYFNDPFFYNSIYNPAGQEVGAYSPPWGVVTMFVSWVELMDGQDVSARLKFMSDYSAYGNLPVGEAIDGVTGNFVHASCPDLYEHGGVYVMTALMREKLCVSMDPHTW